MGDAIPDHLALIPWVATLLNNPKWTRTRTASRVPKSSGEDSFFAETLATDHTIRACLTFKPTDKADGDFPFREIVTVVDLGDGLNGYPQICHGGMLATLLDEVCGVLIVELKKERSLRFAKESVSEKPTLISNYMTAYLNTIYKKPVPAPHTLLCTAKIERQVGRKLYVRGTLEDGAGTIYTVGEAMFIQLKAQL